MKEIRTNGYLYSVDLEKTKEYYSKQAPCDDVGFAYYNSNIKEKYPKLAAFLEKFGVDIKKPDSMITYEFDGKFMYMCVNYTVCGEYRRTSRCREDVNEHVTIEVFDGADVYSDLKEGEYFHFSLGSIYLPCDTAKASNTSNDTFTFDGLKERMIELYN